MENKQRSHFLKENGIRIESKFIPFSRSRNKDNKDLSLNWKVTLFKDDKAILETDYSAGIAHCKTYKGIKNPMRLSVLDLEEIRRECEMGNVNGWGAKTMPDTLQVLSSLCLDADAGDYLSFEDWADSLGLNPDSIKDKKIYDACLDIERRMRLGLGNELLGKLREVMRDY